MMPIAFDIGFGKTPDEIFKESLPVQGSIPEWLSGDLLRNGPGTYIVGNEEYRHWFDGLAMLHRFSFNAGEVSYRNKFLECNAYNAAMQNNRIVYPEFATIPHYSFIGRIKKVFKGSMTDSAKVNIGKVDGKILALGETSMQVEFDPSTLDSIRIFNYDSKVNRHMTTVHPLHDRLLDRDYNITARFNRVSRYRVLRIGESRKPSLEASIRVKEVSYMHSFGMSPNYFILTEFPLLVNPLSIVLSPRPYIENFRWKPEKGTRIHIINRKTGSRDALLVTDPFFAFHHVNTFEKDGLLFMDIVCYPDSDVVHSFYIERIREGKKALPLGELRRYIIDLSDLSVRFEVLGNAGMEMPRYDDSEYSMDGTYQYVYGIGVNSEKPESFYNQLVKQDIQTGRSKTWYEEGSYPGEGVFIGKPGRKTEDDGVLVSVVLNEKKENSFLLVLDAASFEEIARAEVPHPILFGYHGAHLGG